MNKPFLKWAGSKRKIIGLLRECIGEIKGRLIEPFVGSGTVFLNVNADEYILSDLNNDLINLFNLLQSNGKELIAYTKAELFTEITNTEKSFYDLRARFNEEEDTFIKSALFVYLNRHAFNGLCRYNKSGGFNVPFGRYKKPYFPEVEMLAFINASTNCRFLCQDFRLTMDMAKVDDVVYCDPPYAPISKTSSFTGYCPGGFNDQDQKDLALKAEQSVNRIIISNNSTEFTRDLYINAEVMEELAVQKSIGSKGNSRKKTKELIVMYN